MEYRDYADRIVPQASNVMGGLLLLVLLTGNFFFLSHGNNAMEGAHAGFSPFFSSWLATFDLHSVWAIVASSVLVLAICVLMIWMNEVFSFISVRTILPAFFFVVFASLMMRPSAFNISYILALLAATTLFSCFHEKAEHEKPTHLFLIGMLVGIQTLISVSCLTYIIVLFPYFYQIRSLSLRTTIAFLIGLFLPFLYAFLCSVCVASAQGSSDALAVSADAWANHFRGWKVYGDRTLFQGMTLAARIYFGFFAGLSIFSAFRAFVSSASQTVKNRLQTLFITFLFFWTLVLFLMGVSDAVLLLPSLLCLGAFLMGQYLSVEYNVATKIVWVIFLLSSLLYYIFPDYNYMG